MKVKSYYTDILTEEFFRVNYLEKRLSFPKLKDLLKENGHDISIGSIYKYCKQLGFITRDHSEARREWEEDPMNYNISYLTSLVIEAIDGFLLGDGSIKPGSNHTMQTARLYCGLQYDEFCKYLMSFFESYKPFIAMYKDKGMSSGFRHDGYSKFHPDIYQQYQRWYKYREGKFIKSVPTDVRITSTSVMMWYLGDGSLVQPEDNSTVMLRLSTDGFTKDEVEYLVIKLKEVGIECHRNNDNRIQIDARGIPAFFDFIGRTSPVKCYDYKFNLPTWRLESKRMKDVANELKIDYNRLCYFVKIGRINCYRLSEKGRPRFLPEHINETRKLIESGELY